MKIKSTTNSKISLIWDKILIEFNNLMLITSYK